MVRRNRGHSASKGLNPSHGPLVSTYQTRIADYGDVEPTHGEAALAAYAELYGRVQRKLFADFSAGKSPASLEEGVSATIRDPGSDVQRRAGVVGREGVRCPEEHGAEAG